MDGTEFCVFFEDPFWVGVVVANRRGQSFVGRVVFGAEPTNAELLLFMRERFAGLLRDARRVPASDRLSRGPKGPMSAKRGIRAAVRDQRSGPGKAIAASHAAFELAKVASRGDDRRRRETESAERFRIRREKKKAAKRGK